MTEAKTKVELQYGSLSIGEDKIVSKAKKAYGKRDINELNIYVKPEEGKAYYVVNGDPSKSGSFDLYD